MVTGIGLFSGGLDSILAVRVLQEQDIQIEAVAFVTPFFGAETARKAVKQLGVQLHIIDITDRHLAMLRSPRHGYGRNMNPCIDCHALMFNRAGQFMLEKKAHFIFSGEVLGERRMSQNRNSLGTVARESGFSDYIIRPLSARLLPPTRPEHEGLVDRARLLDLQGRSRKPQIALARQFGITWYPEPAGGCRLTNPSFSTRVRDLLEHADPVTRRDLELLNYGRHLRLNSKVKILVGRNERENNSLEALREPGDVLLCTETIPGPVVLIPGGADEEIIRRAASVCARYSDAPAGEKITVLTFRGNRSAEKLLAASCPEEYVKESIL